MSQNQELLIDHLDQLLAGVATTPTAQLIGADKERAQEWQSLLFAIDGIREAGLYDKVSSVKKQYYSQQSLVSKPAGGVVRSIYRNAFRVAACLFLLIGATAVYKFSMVNSAGIYQDNFNSYELNTSRGAGVAGDIEEAYQAKKWQEVIALAATENPKTTKTSFLSGMAAMETKNFEYAIAAFSQVLSINKQSGDNKFHDEAEYYLAMSYLARNDSEKAVPLFNKIRQDKGHIYNDRAENMSGIDLKVLEMKK